MASDFLLADGFATVSGGCDAGKSPYLIRPDQIAFGVNTIVRGGFLKPRPGVTQFQLNYPSDIVELRQKSGKFQVAGYYKPDSGPECLLASIGGRQFRFNVLTDYSVQEITITFETTTTVNFAPPPIGASVIVDVVTTQFLSVGAIILINGNNYEVDTIVSPTQVTVINVDDAGLVNPVPAGSAVVSYNPNSSTIDQAWEVQAEMFWVLQDGQSLPFIYDGASSRRARSNLPSRDAGGSFMGREIGPGRMMAYGMGRLWKAEVDQRSFSAGDLVFGISGSATYGLRDSVLKLFENDSIADGGLFTTPEISGGISGMRFIANLDTSLGQGPLQVITPETTFSVNTPLDRTAWAALENPIQTISLKANGGLSHYSSILVNGDLFFRASDGIRSFILARREFSTWGNTPISREMDRVLNLDDQSLLTHSSAVHFDNRLLMTCSPVRTDHGIYHRGWISLDFDPISGMGQKAPAVYDGVHVGLNVLQLVKGQFGGVERCFAFSLNAEQEIELYELTTADRFDHQQPYGADVRINWAFETRQITFASARFPDQKIPKRLHNLELEIAQLAGEVHFKVYYKPDNYPCWVFWKEWDECSVYKNCQIDELTDCLTNKNFKPQFRPRMSIGQPANDCDPITNRPLRDGYSFQVRVEITGYCEIANLILTAEDRKEATYGSLSGCNV